MLLFKKKDLLIVLSKSGTTVQFTKPLKDILKYQYRYNYKFVMYENGAVTVADDYVIDGETLTVLFGSATVAYTSEGATYTEGGSGGGSGESFTLYGPYTALIDETQRIQAGGVLDYAFESFLDIIGNKTVVYPSDEQPKTFLTGVTIAPSSSNPNFTLEGFSSDSVAIRNKSDSELVLPARNGIQIYFYSTVEYPEEV